MLVAMEILEGHPPRPQDFWHTLGNIGRYRRPSGGDGHANDALRVKQTTQVILIGRRAFDDPFLNLLLRFDVLRVFEKAPHQPGKSGVLEKNGGIFHALLAILRQLADFQFRDGRKLVLGCGAELPFVVPVIEGAPHDNSQRQDGEDQHEAPHGAALGWLRQVHDDDLLLIGGGLFVTNHQAAGRPPPP